MKQLWFIIIRMRHLIIMTIKMLLHYSAECNVHSLNKYILKIIVNQGKTEACLIHAILKLKVFFLMLG